jgi:hypothetical protein
MQVGDVKRIHGFSDIGRMDVVRSCGLGLTCCDPGKEDIVCDAYAD